MTTSNKLAYGTLTALSPSNVVLAQGQAHQCTALNNSTIGYVDADIYAKITTPSGGLSTNAPPLINVYVASSPDGVNWCGYGSGNVDGVTGSDASIALDSPSNLPRVGQWTITQLNGTFITPKMNVATAYNGVLPAFWSLIFENQTGGQVTIGSASFAGDYTTNG